MKRMLDLFCGRWGWSRAFAARGWECIGVDLVEPVEVPKGCEFIHGDIKALTAGTIVHRLKPDFICASPPCQEFSKFGIACFYPDPPYPAEGIALFNHVREVCWNSKVPYIIENVNAAQKFIGYASQHCGPFYLWGSGVPPLLIQGIKKGGQLGTGGWQNTGSKNKKENAASVATIPLELANCVAEYAERIQAVAQI